MNFLTLLFRTLFIKLVIVIIAVLFLFFTGYLPKKEQSKNEKIKDSYYQLQIHNDTLWLFNNDRYVGKAIDTSWNSPLMELILSDNQ